MTVQIGNLQYMRSSSRSDNMLERFRAPAIEQEYRHLYKKKLSNESYRIANDNYGLSCERLSDVQPITHSASPSETSQKLSCEIRDSQTSKADSASGDVSSPVEERHAMIFSSEEATKEKIADASDIISDEDIIEQVKILTKYENASMLPSGELLVLPPDWCVRESRTLAGYKYFVSPTGESQWIRPPVKTGYGYNFVREIEVNFGVGRLGLNLKHITSDPGAIFTDLIVYIADFYKLRNGMPSPAELYNWSMKPENRICIGMRMTAIDHLPLNGYTYAEVLDTLNRAARPVRIKFADVSRGIVGRVASESRADTSGEEEKKVAAAKQQSLHLEYLQTSVFFEVQIEVWQIQKGTMEQRLQELAGKQNVAQREIDVWSQNLDSLKEDAEKLKCEEVQHSNYIELLRREKEGRVGSSEERRALVLIERNKTLTAEVEAMSAEYERLRERQSVLQRERSTLEKTVVQANRNKDEQKELSTELEEFAYLAYEIDVQNLKMTNDGVSVQEQIKQAKNDLMAQIEWESATVKRFGAEIQQFRRKSKAIDASSKQFNDIISGRKAPRLVFLERKIENLRQQLRHTLSSERRVSYASQFDDDTDMTKSQQAQLKQELKIALEELRTFGDVPETASRNPETQAKKDGFHNLVSASSRKSRGDVQETMETSTSDDDTPISIADRTINDHLDSLQRHVANDEQLHCDSIRSRISQLRTNLHDTVKQLARAAATKDSKRISELSSLRISLKEEMRSTENEYNRLTHTWLEPDISKPRTASDGFGRFRHSLPPPRSLGQRALSIPFNSDHSNEEAHCQTTIRAQTSSTLDDGLYDRSMGTESRSKRTFSLTRMRGSRISMKRLNRRPSGTEKDLRVVKSDIEAQLRDLDSSMSKVSSGDDIGELQRHRSHLKKELETVSARLEEESILLVSTDTRESSFHRFSVRASRKRSIEKAGKEAPFVKPVAEASIRPSELPVAYTDTVMTKQGNLMKHPRRAQDKGLFGNLTLRGAQERWCEIDPSGLLKYYRRQEDIEPRGTFPLGDSSLEIVYDAVNNKSKAFTISVTTQQIRFQAKSHEDMLEWILPKKEQLPFEMKCERPSTFSKKYRTTANVVFITHNSLSHLL
uniref:Uncharacterized protein AlNc14C113G6448 n=1 Tax=Albugo laibachii Nc14 TaxID=890382 RepID=F0WIQ9_9STRA|nr:conserved hypothetical protein [Albugo laibachii Nc14]|eukprot:CCA21153.1 conserved hypothetical protein [Albugo laibachii Nc14]